MKKRVGLFLFAMALTAVTLVSRPKSAEASGCIRPWCFASPGCCAAWECDSWCGGVGLGVCRGVSGNQGSCCSCNGWA